MKCIKDRCYSPVACGGFGHCRDLNFKDEIRQLIFDAIGGKALAIGVELNEAQVMALADSALANITKAR